MKKAERIVGIILVVVALAVIGATASYPKTGVTDVGAGFFPKWISVATIILSVLLIFDSFVSTMQLKKIFIAKKSLLGILFTMFYLVVTYLVGFYVSTFLYLMGFMWFLKFRKISGLIIVTASTMIFIYATFEFALKVPMPSGILFN